MQNTQLPTELKGNNIPKEIVLRQTNNRLEYYKTHDAPNKRQTTYRKR
ncbi:MAG: hypothetical protein ACRD47_02230 [Nitrososphaeraceae archaeon]